jgi:GATA-binding protein
MTDRAAAEALVAVGRFGHGSPGEDESDGEGGIVEQPRKKRMRKSGGGKDQRGGREEEEGDGLEGEEGRKKMRDSTGWVDSNVSPSTSPRMDHGQHARHHGQFLGSPHPHGGFDLPPLNHALGGGGDRTAYGGGYANPTFPGATSSYIRSGSNAPSRTHSPLGPGALGTTTSGTGYMLPPPHSLTPHPYYPGLGHSPPPSDATGGGGVGGVQPSSVMAGLMGMGLGVMPSVPSLADVERHYYVLLEQKRAWEDMMQKTDRMVAAVKRGLDDMKAAAGLGGSSQQQQPPQQHQKTDGASGRQGGEKERRESVWPVSDGPPRE